MSIDPRLVEVAKRFDRTAGARDVRRPELTETLGRALATALESDRPDVVVAWESSAGAMLGHVVARCLSADLVLAAEDLGRLELDGSVTDRRTTAISIDWTDDARGLAPLAGLLRNSGAVLVSVGSLLPVPEAITTTAGVPVRAVAGPSETPPTGRD